MTTDRDSTCPVARMDALACEFLAQCHAEAHHQSVKVGQPPVPCLYCGRDPCLLARRSRRVRAWPGSRNTTAIG